MSLAGLVDEIMEMLPVAVAECGGVKQAAFDLDRAPSTVANQMHGRDQHRPGLDLVAWVVANQKSGAVLARLNDAAGFEKPKRKVELTPEERLAKLEAALRDADLLGVFQRKAGL